MITAGPFKDTVLTSAYNTYASQTPVFSDHVLHGHEDAYNNLATGIGEFGALRVHDQLANISNGIDDASVDTHIKNWDSGLCMDLDKNTIAAIQAWTGQSQMIAGIPFTLGDCNNPSDWWTATWGWDSKTGRIFNLAYQYFANTAWCLESGSHRGEELTTAPCDGSPGQTWTYDSIAGKLRNERVALATLHASGTSIGSVLVTGTPDLSEWAQTGDGWGGI